MQIGHELMDLADLEIAVAAARAGSFAAVSRDRGIEPSKVSRVVSGLEAELGFRLFQRSTRRMAETEAGALFLDRAAGMLADLTAAREEAAGLSRKPRGVLRLTASVAFGTARVVPLLAEFQALYPEIKLDLVFTDANLDLLSQRLDLAVRLAPSVSGDLVCRRLMPVRYRIVAAPGYIARTGALDTPEDLSRRRCLFFDLPSYRGPWRVRDAAGRITAVRVDGDVVSSSAVALFEAAKAGLGPALLPDWLVDPEIAAGRLSDLLPDHEASAGDFDTAAWLIYPSRRQLPLKTRAMIDFLRARLPSRGSVPG